MKASNGFINLWCHLDATMAQQASLDEFRAGVTACLRSWSALKTAVDSGWGGLESLQKAEDLRQYIYDSMDGSSRVPKNGLKSPLDLEDNLAIYMEEEYSVVLEDGSERQLANYIFEMYEKCLFQSDYNLARQAVASCQQAQAVQTQYQSKAQSANDDDDDDDSDDDDDAMEDITTDDNAAEMTNGDNDTNESVSSNLPSSAAEYAAQPLFGDGGKKQRKEKVQEQPIRQLGEEADEPEPEAMVDDDGFAPVVKRKGRR